jgi:hypothetical protein
MVGERSGGVMFAAGKHVERARLKSPAQAEADAYELLEEARLRCEQLDSEGAGIGERAPLRVLHREVGLAGFLASSNIPSRRRQKALASAHISAGSDQLEAQDAESALVALMERACDAVEQGLIAPGLSDHMGLAHAHVVRAQQLMANIFHVTQPPGGARAPAPWRPAAG